MYPMSVLWKIVPYDKVSQQMDFLAKELNLKFKYKFSYLKGYNDMNLSYVSTNFTLK